MMPGKWLKILLVSGLSITAGGSAWAQSGTWAPPPPNRLEQAQGYEATKEYDKAIELYRQLYEESGEAMYTPYINVLITAQKYKEAEKVAQGLIAKNSAVYMPEVDLGRVYKLEGKDKKAAETFDAVVARINGDDMLTQRIVKAFTDAGETDYAIKAYEAAIHRLGNSFLYGLQLATLYAKADKLDRAMETILATGPGQYFTVENVKSLFLQWIGTDPKKLQTAQKYLLKRINDDPGNVFYVQLLTWIYTQKDDWDGALMQMEAIDERNNEDGKTLLDFAATATRAGQYQTAYKAYDEIMAKGAERPLYSVAKKEKMTAELQELESTPDYKPETVTRLLGEYNELFAAYPSFYGSATVADYAMVAAQYADSIDKGIAILEKAVKYPDTKQKLAGTLKLQLGDYYLIKGKVWEASLLYSQVDKEFKQDAQGEEARFRNAKLHYYRGDFEWAQSMLTVLKRSTSELIANDALFLSVQITENAPDSNYYALSRFAYADLLLFQNKDKQAEALLDSISAAFPKHELNDDIIMQRAKIEMKHRQYDKAITLLNDIAQKYGQDVLADDAIFQIAEIYYNNLHKKDSAKEYYERLIIDYPGSTFVQTARQRLQDINNPVAP